jgi:hypothetical protein
MPTADTVTARAEQVAFLEERRQLVLADPRLTGLDRIGVTRDGPASWRLTLHFLTGAGRPATVPAGLSLANLRLTSADGERLAEPRFVASFGQGGLGSVAGHPQALVRCRDERLGQTLAASGEVFVLSLVGLPEVDAFFRQASFSLGPEPALPALEASAPSRRTPQPLDYMARDYESVRTLLLDQMALRLPGWTERNPADLGIAITEILAYATDYLSYFQDAVGTEAYLGTARRRISVRRHGRLVDYFLDEGANARCWVVVAVSAPVTLPRGTQLLSRSGNAPPVVSPTSWEYEQALAQGAVVFETVTSAQLEPGRDRLAFYTWGAQTFALAQGATQAALAGHVVGLAAGDVLILEEVASPLSGLAEEANPDHRHAVRLESPPVLSTDPATGQAFTAIAWFGLDALPFPLVVAARAREQPLTDLAVARGNAVLADHGRTVAEALPVVLPGAPYRPTLTRPDLTFRAVPDVAALAHRPAAVALVQEPSAVLPALTLVERDPLCLPDRTGATSGLSWLPRRDLLESDRFARELVVEMTDERAAQLRFGDGEHGRAPAIGSRFEAYYRVGNGPTGNLAHGTLAHIATDLPAVLGAANPVAAVGGRAWESLERARLLIPTAFHTQRRCVTADDFEAAACTHPDVLAAAVRLRWEGTWNTAFLYLQRRGGRDLDAKFLAEMEALLRPLLVAGMDLALRPPTWVALGIALTVTVAAAQNRAVVRNQLEDAFSDRRLADGSSGFFYPDNLRFGQPIYLADLIARASAIAGVVEVEATRFSRLDHDSTWARDHGTILLSDLEIAQVANQPQLPELGTIRFTLEAGR